MESNNLEKFEKSYIKDRRLITETKGSLSAKKKIKLRRIGKKKACLLDRHAGSKIDAGNFPVPKSASSGA